MYALVNPCLLRVNADPTVIPCLAKGIAAGRFVDLALAYSLGSGNAPDVTCRRLVLVLAGISLLVVREPLPLLMPALLLIDGSFLIFRSLLAFVLMLGWRMLPALLLVNPFGPPPGWILLIGLLRHPLALFRMFGMLTGMCLELFLMMLFLPFSRFAVDDFWCIWSDGAEAGLCRAYSLAGRWQLCLYW